MAKEWGEVSLMTKENYRLNILCEIQKAKDITNELSKNVRFGDPKYDIDFRDFLISEGINPKEHKNYGRSDKK